jgi:hypothetical protein
MLPYTRHWHVARAHIWNPFPWQSCDRKPNQFWKLRAVYLRTHKLHCQFILYKSAKHSNTLAYVVNYNFKSIFPITISVFLLHMLCRTIHITIIPILIHYSFSVLNYLLSAGRPNFAQVALTTRKVERAACSRLTRRSRITKHIACESSRAMSL